ncbi:MAG TPA: N-formylglutamate amidohydrolase [Enhygromyxa sp.]|nr:N-formylglutamate amidohydrolase [Enhygromyxa sp.]
MSELGSTETIDPIAVGVDGRDPLPFEFRPALRESPLIVSFPHVGLDWPASLGPRPQVNFPRNADYAVDRLYVRAEALGAATIRARYSRLVVDLNRADDDVSAELVPDHPSPRPRSSLGGSSSGSARRPIRNRGVVWRTAVGNIPLLTCLSYAQFRARIDRFHRPYYRALELLIERRRQRFGYAVVLDAHSMPGSVGGDLVLGTRGGHACGPELRSLAEATLSGKLPSLRGRFGSRWPLSLAIDDPYRGGELIATFGRPEDHVHALQLEVSRALYMDELRCDLSPIPDPRDLEQPRLGPKPRAPQDQQRERRRLLALVAAIDALLAELSRTRDELADRAAAE